MIAQLFDYLEHSSGRLARSVEVGDRRLVGCRFLGAAVAQQRAPSELGSTADDGRANLRLAGHGRGGTQNDREDRLRAGAAQGVPRPRQVTAGNVTGLVSEDADDLVGSVARHQETGEDEDVLPPGDECVEPAVVDDVNANRPGV